VSRIVRFFRGADPRVPAVLAAAVLVLCAIFQVAVIAPLQEQARQTGERAAQGNERARMQRAMQERLALDEDPARQLQLFYDFFDNGPRLPDALARLHNAASAYGIALDQGEYRLSTDSNGRLLRYQITLPVQGAYPNIRKFVARALRELPSAALDQISFERAQIGENRIDAQVRLTLYMVDGER
jgi:hypothetical protein